MGSMLSCSPYNAFYREELQGSCQAFHKLFSPASSAVAKLNSRHEAEMWRRSLT